LRRVPLAKRPLLYIGKAKMFFPKAPA